MSGKYSEEHKYDDIINLSHHVSQSRTRMSIHDRAAQFSPFAALTGYESEIEETARITSDCIELDEEIKDLLNKKLGLLKEYILEEPEVEITYFKADERRSGGTYITIKGIIKKIDSYKNIFVMLDGTEIYIKDIIKIEGKIFDKIMDKLIE